MTMMLAARLHKVGEPMRLEHVPVPEPRPTDVLVAVKACGVVPNLINVLTHWQTWFPELPLPKLPAIFGLDVAGEIAAVGEQVQNFRKGDRVYVNPGLFCGSCPRLPRRRHDELHQLHIQRLFRLRPGCAKAVRRLSLRRHVRIYDRAAAQSGGASG